MPPQGTRAIYVNQAYTLADNARRTTSPATLASLGGLLTRAAETVGDEAVVLLDETAAYRLGLPINAIQLDAFPGLEKSLPGGWKAPMLRDWTTFTSADRPTLHVGILPLVAARGECPFVTQGAWPEDVVAAFVAWHRLTGRAWHHGPTAAGLSVMRSVMPGARNAPTVAPEVPALLKNAQESPVLLEHFCRPVDPGVQSRWDKTRAYIGAASCVMLAPWALKHSTSQKFDATRAGWWLVELGPWNYSSHMPNPAGYGEPVRWVTTPTLVLLEELAAQGLPTVDFRVLESYTGPGRPLLKPWASRMRDAYDGAAMIPDAEEALMVMGAVKDAGRRALGALASPTNWWRRPDWWAAIIAMHRSNMWRALWRLGQATGRWPVQIEVDAVWLPGEEAPAGFRIGDMLGGWKAKGKRMLRERMVVDD